MKMQLKQMNNKELTRLEIIQKLEDKRLTQAEAGELLGVCSRQVRRLAKAYRQQGVEALISKRRGKSSNRQYPDAFKKKVLHAFQERYGDFGPTLASEKLQEREELSVNKETLRQWLIRADLWKEKRRRAPAIHPQRARRACFGELVQIDGSLHDWFEGRAPRCCLLVFVDDATSTLMQLRFEPAETTHGYFSAVYDYLQRYGRPLAFYSDRHSIFRINLPEAKSGTGETQFGRAMRELDIQCICAYSPQAKGRVERMNSTLQDRLVKELRLQNIDDIPTANAFLPRFMEAYNTRFAVPAASPNDAHRKTLPSEGMLQLIFTYQSFRKLSKNLEFSYHHVIYHIKTVGTGYGMRYAQVTVCEDTHQQITLLYKNRVLEYSTLDKKNQPAPVATGKEMHTLIDQPLLKQEERPVRYKPKAEHPWRQYETVMKKQAARQQKASLKNINGHLPTGSTRLAGV